jgi:chemotaxis protein MotA
MKKRRGRLDLTSAGGIVIGVGLVLMGQVLEGGALRSVLQLTAAVIVFGGTLGAVLVSFSFDEVRLAARRLRNVFINDEPEPERLVRAIVRLATIARQQGIIGLENEADKLGEPYLKKGLMLAVDGNSPQDVRELLEVEDSAISYRETTAAQVYESAGGYAPTLGILGAVLGLIQVMEHLSDPSRLGAGIAVAFVATVYGVGSANLIFLPIAAKLRARARRGARHRELMMEGIMGIQGGLSPRFIRAKLESFLDEGVELPGPRVKGRAA